MIIHSLKIFLYIVSLVLYIIDNNPTDIIINSFSSKIYATPKSINIDMSRMRKYEQTGEFDSYKAFRFLFPGNFYKHSMTEKKTEASSWWYVRYDYWFDEKGNIKKIDNKFNSYKDYERALDKYENDKGKQREIYSETNFNVTVYFGIINYSDNNKKFKYLFFNTGTDPQYTSRFSGGDLGYARFVQSRNKWLLDEFFPKIKCFGYFGYSNIPTNIVKLKKNTYGFYVKVARDTGPVGSDFNPIDSYSFILLKIGNKYKQIFKEETTDLKNSYKTGGTEWKSNIIIEDEKSNGLNNIKLEISGLYDPKFPEEDKYLMEFDLLEPYKSKFKEKQNIHNFKIVKHYRFNGEKYVMVKEEFSD